MREQKPPRREPDTDTLAQACHKKILTARILTVEYIIGAKKLNDHRVAALVGTIETNNEENGAGVRCGRE